MLEENLKSPKLRRQTAPQTESDAGPSGPLLQRLRTSALGELRAQLQVIATRRKELQRGGFDPQLVSASCHLAKTILAVEAEARAQAKAQRQADSQVTEPQVMSFLRGLAPERRRQIVRELQAMDSDRSVLS